MDFSLKKAKLLVFWAYINTRNIHSNKAMRCARKINGHEQTEHPLALSSRFYQRTPNGHSGRVLNGWQEVAWSESEREKERDLAGLKNQQKWASDILPSKLRPKPTAKLLICLPSRERHFEREGESINILFLSSLLFHNSRQIHPATNAPERHSKNKQTRTWCGWQFSRLSLFLASPVANDTHKPLGINKSH